MVSCWSAHVDNKQDLSGAHLTAVVNASPFRTAMRICGDADHFEYNSVGDTALFPSDLFHYTSQACIGTIKIAFFYSIVSSGRSVSFEQCSGATDDCDVGSNSAAMVRMPISQRKEPRHAAGSSGDAAVQSSVQDRPNANRPNASIPIKKRRTVTTELD